MNSLRVRLIAGFALVAIVPLAVAMLLIGQRLQSTVRAQASARLASALHVMRAQLDDDADRLTGRLALLADDAQLKRLYLVESAGGASLREQLATQQYLLGLDYLYVADTAGAVVADGGAAPLARPRPGREPVDAATLAPRRTPGLEFAPPAAGRALALDAAATITYRDAPVGLVRGGLLLDSLRLAELRETSGVELALWDSAGRPLAGTLPGAAALAARGGSGPERIRLGGASYFARRDTLSPGGGPQVRIAGLVPTAGTDATLAALRTTTLVIALLAGAVAVLLGLAWSLQVSRPVERLAEFSQRISRGEWDEPLTLASVREVQALVAALERMRADLRGYRERLVANERQAAYGQMARKVAHEIKNPLTPIAVSVADLKRSYEQGRPDFPQILDRAVRTIDEEVQSLKRLLKEFSDLGRFPPPAPAPCDPGALLAEVGALFAHESAEGRLVLAPPAGPIVASADRAQLRQALVNLVQNGLDAAAPDGRVRLAARAAGGSLELVVADEGPGLSPEQKARLFVPGFTTKAQGSGLGLVIVERIVTDHGGTIEADSAPGRGTSFTIRLPLSRGA
ncbi:MAG: ATP-binding protein [Candidatus Eisenbacteria bacterium]|nr:ATP-binding protein [Candidatus Eisenbacteria bacterium]